jgi:hypothetical protein
MAKRKNHSIKSPSDEIARATRKLAHEDGYKTSVVRKSKSGYSFTLGKLK